MPTFDPEQMGLLLVETARAWRNRLDQRLKPLGLTQGKWTTLVHLAHGGEKLTQNQIAARIGIEEPTLAGLLNRLERDGLIERRDAADDRRCKTVHLQRRSHTLIDRILREAQELRHELLATIPKRDLEVCMRVLTQIRDHTEQPCAVNGTAKKSTRIRAGTAKSAAQ